MAQVQRLVQQICSFLFLLFLRMGVSPSVLQAAEQTYASYTADLSVAEVVYAEEVALALAM